MSFKELVWLDFKTDLKCILQLPKGKIDNLFKRIEIIMSSVSTIVIRLIAKFCGKIISVTPVISHISQIMNRSVFACESFGMIGGKF